MSAVEKLALAVTTGKDVSEPVTSDVSGRTPLIQPPEDLLNIADADAQRQLSALPAVDKARVNAYLDAARGMLASNPSGAAQFALRACMICATCCNCPPIPVLGNCVCRLGKLFSAVASTAL